ncbi:CAF1 family ribonuclease [Gregarina niphandrodes]|uniref:poly(A)-specific ribonuclease n=1 Tax=Gregarina niphandrodes TaxID=110365 RepID=A0A023B915_GRENI|nr:CAF1 family ribonuclease [Gregarina niphandrodes]EZG70666.1 CAF1 family ribonuclease [Gregarina niphandrodes]|eukprot:XP_011129907.1 CAF1 family ribonuclease [Gregarina niphandrodes]
MSGCSVRQVWRGDLDVAMEDVRALTEKYPYVSLNVLWAGFVARPICCHEYAYASVKDAVDLCDPLQIGLSFADSHGRKPNYSVQFNLYFPRNCLVQETMDTLISQGYDAAKAALHGIEANDFAEAMLTSELVTNEDIRWITYHGSYDLGFVYRALTTSQLPETRDEYIRNITEYFPYLYDVKTMLCSKFGHRDLPGGLRSACDFLGLGSLPIVVNPDASSRAGINSLLVSACFFNALGQFFDNKIDDAKFKGQLYGVYDDDPLDDDLSPNGSIGVSAKLPPGMLRLKPGTYSPDAKKATG